VINQKWQSLPSQDTAELARELALLRAELKARATEPEQDLEIAEIAAAQVAAQKNDGPTALKHLAKAGKWALDVATTIGTNIAVAAIRAAAGL
jgi:hypothetical protein